MSVSSFTSRDAATLAQQARRWIPARTSRLLEHVYTQYAEITARGNTPTAPAPQASTNKKSSTSWEEVCVLEDVVDPLAGTASQLTEVERYIAFEGAKLDGSESILQWWKVCYLVTPCAISECLFDRTMPVNSLSSRGWPRTFWQFRRQASLSSASFPALATCVPTFAPRSRQKRSPKLCV